MIARAGCLLALSFCCAASSRAQTTLTAEVAHGAYHVPGVANVAVHVPEGFDPKAPLHLVVYIHGYSGCLDLLLGEGEARCRAEAPVRQRFALDAHHDAAGTQTLLVVPQLAFDKRNGAPGSFGTPGGFRAFLDELLGMTLPQRGVLPLPQRAGDLAGITLLVHSAGFETALSILQRGEVDALVRSVVLFDALYAHAPQYAGWVIAHADAGVRLVALHLGRGRTYAQGELLRRRLRGAFGDAAVTLTSAAGLAAAVRSHRFVFASAEPPHWRVPGNHLTALLRALPLPRRVPEP